MRMILLAVLLLLGCDDGRSPTEPRTQYKEGADCGSLEVETPRRGEPHEIPMQCRPVR